MASMNEKLASLEGGMNENKKTIWRLFEAIYGNGKPGLIADVKELKTKVSDIKEDISGIKQNLKTVQDKLTDTNQALALLKQSVEEHHQSVEDLQKRSRANWQWVVTIVVAIISVVVAIIK